MSIWSLHLQRDNGTVVIVNGQSAPFGIKLPLPFVNNLDLSSLAQLSKIPGGTSIYYFPLISGGPRRSAKQLINQVKLWPRVWDGDLTVLYCTSAAAGMFFFLFPQRLQRAFCLLIPLLRMLNRTLENCIQIAGALIVWQPGMRLASFTKKQKTNINFRSDTACF